MIINVRGCSNRTGIIVSYLIENEKKTGYASFSTKKILVKNKTEMLTAIKKTLISSREFPEIDANDFVSTVDKIGKKNTFDTPLKALVKAVNDENMRSTMSTLSHAYFNDKPLPQIKAINIINDNMYFMIKIGTSYNLELIEIEKIKCVIVVSSLVNLYRRIKHGGVLPKNAFKKHYISKTRRPGEVIRNIYRSFGEEGVNVVNDNSPAEPVLEEGIIDPSEIVTVGHNEAEATLITPSWYGPTLYTYANDATAPSPERQQTEQRERLGEIPTDTEGPDIDTAEREAEERRDQLDTNETEEDRPTNVETTRQAFVNGDMFTVIETPQPTITNEEEDRPIGIDLSEGTVSEIDEDLSRLHEEEIPTTGIGIVEAERLSLLETRRRYEGLVMRPPEENITNTDEADEEVPSTRQAVTASMRRSMPRQTEEERRMSTERRNTFVNYLRDNQASTTYNLRENNDIGIDY